MKMKSLFCLLISSMIFVSCSKATSEAQYKYRKSAGDGVAAKVGDITITDQELMNEIQGELFDAEMKIFEIKFNKLNELVIDKLIKKDPKGAGLTADQYFDKFIASDIKISSKDFNAFVEEKKIPANQINDQVKVKIENYLVMQKKDEAIKNWLGEKTGKSGIEVFFQKPERPTYEVNIEGSPFMGKADAKVTIVEFSDFQCPYCAEGSKVIKKLKAKYGDKLKVVMKQFPLPFHTQAKKASLAALCANEQNTGAFWKMHDQLFADQSKLAEDQLKELAVKLGLNAEQFNKCLDENKHIATVEKDIQDGKSVGVKSTPTFFVNGKLVAGALPVEAFSELIDQELSL